MCALLCAAAVTLSAVGGLPAVAEAGENAGETAEATEENDTKRPAPQNIRLSEDKKKILWDAVGDVICFNLFFPGHEDLNCTGYLLTEYDIDRLEAGEYTVEISTYGSDEKSEPFTFTIDSCPAPTNVYVDENDVIHWDAVEGAASYRVRLENKEGGTLTASTETNYADWKSEWGIYNWNGCIYTKDHALTVSVAAVSELTVGEYSEPVAFTYSLDTWKANFKYDEETGELSWDNWTDDVSNGNLHYYLWGIPADPYPRSIISLDSGYWNPAFSGYDIPFIYLPLEFAYRSLQNPDTDYRGDHTLRLTSSALGSAEEWWTDKIGDYESTDTFTYSYDGCDINPALKPPKDNLWQGGGGWASDITDYITAAWDPVDGAVGYIVHFTCRAGNWNADAYTSTYSNSLIYSWYNGSPDGAWCLEICSVDKNGDRSEWSEPLYFTVKDGKVVDGLNYAYLNNIDSEGSLLLTEATGAVRYTVGVTGNGADLSFESETPVIEGFSDALKGYPAGEYTIVISTYNNIGVCRWLVGSFNKQDEGFFNEGDETGSAVESAPEAAGIPESDKIPAVAINPAFNLIKKGETDVFFNIDNIKIKAKEIYDEEGLKRAEEALGEEIIGNKHYNLLDLTLWEGNTDISNGYEGLVKVTIPLPTGHLDKTFHVYRFIVKDGKWGYEEIPGEQTEDSYIIYLEHFSEYALVADGGEEPHTHTFSTEWKSDSSSHWHECACGEKSELTAHTENSGVITTAPTTEATGVKTYSCTVCGYAMRTETVDKLEPSKQGFYSDGTTISDAAVGTTVTQKTEVKDGTYDVRFIQKVNADTLAGKSKATFTLTSSKDGSRTVSTTKYYTGLTFDDGTSAKAESGQAFLCYTVTGVPENVTVTADRVVLE